MWGASLKRDIILSHGICFDEEIDYKEDHLFMAEYISYIQTIGIINSEAYHYRMTPQSLVYNNGDSIVTANKAIKVCYKAIQKLENCTTKKARTIFIFLARLFMNDAWMEWYNANFSILVNYEQLYLAVRNFSFKYVFQSDLSFKEILKEGFLHLPIFRIKWVWAGLFNVRKIG